MTVIKCEKCGTGINVTGIGRGYVRQDTFQRTKNVLRAETSEVSRLRERLNDARRCIRVQEEQIESLQCTLKQCRKGTQEMIGKLDDKRARIEGLRERNAELAERNDALSKATHNLQQDNRAVKDAMAGHVQKNTELREALALERKENRALENLFKTRTAKLAKAIEINTDNSHGAELL